MTIAHSNVNPPACPGFSAVWKSLGAVLLLAMLAGRIRAATEPPQLDALFPSGGQLGTTLTVRAEGRLGNGPLQAWADDPGIILKPAGTNGEFQVSIAPTTGLGAHVVRVFQTEGVSNPRLFVVGPVPEAVLDSARGTNPPPRELAPSPVPVTLNGRLGRPGESALFPLIVGPDQVLHARLVARGIDSPAQAALTLMTADGTPLVVTPRADEPKAELRCPFPLGGNVRLAVALATNAPAASNGVYRIDVNADALVPIVASAPITANSENVTAYQRHRNPVVLMIPSETRGRVSLAGTNMAYSFHAARNQEFRFVARAGSVGSGLAPVLRVTDLAGNQFAAVVAPSDAELTWLAPSEGDYLLNVSDAQGRGGRMFTFQLEVSAPVSRFSATLEEDHFALRPGESVDCRVRIHRAPGVIGVLQVSAHGLPAGVTAEPVHGSQDHEHVTLRLRAEPGARPANGPFRIAVLSTADVPPRVEFARFTLPARYASADELLLRDSDQPWCTVLP